MKKIFLATLMLASTIAVSMHTSLKAMEVVPTTQIINTSNKPLQVTYTRANDTREVMRKIAPNMSFSLEQSAGNPIQQMFIKFSDVPNGLSKEIAPVDIVGLIESSKNIAVYESFDNPNEIHYEVKMANGKPAALRTPESFSSEKELSLQPSKEYRQPSMEMEVEVGPISKKSLTSSPSKRSRNMPIESETLAVEYGTITKKEDSFIKITLPRQTSQFKKALNPVLFVTKIECKLKGNAITIVPSAEKQFLVQAGSSPVKDIKGARTFVPSLFGNWPEVYDISQSPVNLMEDFFSGTAFIMIGTDVYGFTHSQLVSLHSKLGPNIILQVDEQGIVSFASDQ